MLTIYSVPISLYCAKLRIVLRHKQLQWREIPPPGGYGSNQYKALVPAGSLPALDHDGLLIGDSEAIAEYLNEAYPEPEMLPGTPSQRAKIRELSRFHDTRLEPSVRALFPLIPSKERDTALLEQNWLITGQRLEQIVPLLPQSTDILTLADCGLAITSLWIDALAAHFDRSNPTPPPFEAYTKSLLEHQAIATEIADYQPKLKQWLAAQ